MENETECIRLGAPYDEPAFEALCREMSIWGTAQAALCAVFWRKGGDVVAESIGAGGVSALTPVGRAQRQAEPVAWRTRYKSEAGMIGNYPWTYTERVRAVERLSPAYEFEPLYAAAPPPAQAPEGWTPADHKAPIGESLLIALSTGKVLIGYRWSGGAWDWPEQDDDADNEASVTHWRRFPSAPISPE